MFKRFHTKQKLIIFLSVFLSLMGVYIGIIWLENDYSQMILEASSGARKAALESAKIKEVARLLEETKEDRDRASTYIISRDGVVSFIESIENLAADSGLGEVAVSGVESIPLGKKGTDPTEELRLVVGGVGSFQNVYRFVAMLETLPYKARIQKVNVQRKGGDEKSPMWSVDTTVYVRKEK